MKYRGVALPSTEVVLLEYSRKTKVKAKAAAPRTRERLAATNIMLNHHGTITYLNPVKLQSLVRINTCKHNRVVDLEPFVKSQY